MEIRFAQTRDLPGILELLRQVGQVHHKGRPDIFRSDAMKYSASQVLGMLDSEQTPIFVAEEDGAVLGYGFCQVVEHSRDSVITDHTSFYIDDLCVDEACRGKGVGKAIYQAILRYAREKHYYNVTLNVWSCNESAMKFYESMGLRPQKVGMETILEES